MDWARQLEPPLQPLYAERGESSALTKTHPVGAPSPPSLSLKKGISQSAPPFSFFFPPPFAHPARPRYGNAIAPHWPAGKSLWPASPPYRCF